MQPSSRDGEGEEKKKMSTDIKERLILQNYPHHLYHTEAKIFPKTKSNRTENSKQKPKFTEISEPLLIY